MSHDLEIREDGSASFVSARGKTAWHSLGFTVPEDEGLLTVDRALKLGGLDWEVTKEPLYQAFRLPNGEYDYRQVPNRFLNVRSNDQKVLGTVGSSYTVVNNREGFEFVQMLLDTGEAVIDTAGALNGGKRVFMSALLPETMKLAGEDYEVYMLFTNSHDGSKGMAVSIVTVRVVCRNTEQMALAGATHHWQIHHRTNIEGKMQEARETLDLAQRYKDAFSKEVEALLTKEVSDAEFEKIIRASFPVQKVQLDKNVTTILDLRHNSPTIPDDQRGTAWGAYNAATEFVSWKPYKNAEARVTNVVGYFQKSRDAIAKALAQV